jgi:hypothetical protein
MVTVFPKRALPRFARRAQLQYLESLMDPAGFERFERSAEMND